MKRLVTALLLLFPAGVVSAPTGRGDELISFQFGAPVAWSLEQAHYLLSKMRHGNLDLPTKKPSADDLSTNKVNANRIDMLQTLIGASAGYSQQVGQKNRLTQQVFDRNGTRRADLQQRQGLLRAGLIDLNKDLAALQKSRAALPDKCPADDAGAGCRELDAGIKALQAQIAVFDNEIKSNDAELLKIPDTVPDFGSAATAYGSTLQPMLPTSLIEGLIAKSSFESPKLHASTMLDNFLQMQYEIIAKQVSMLRDEMQDRDGNVRRLMFIELPQTLVTRQKWFYQRHRVAQTYWKITGVKRSVEHWSHAVEAARFDRIDSVLKDTLCDYPLLNSSGTPSACGNVTPKPIPVTADYVACICDLKIEELKAGCSALKAFGQSVAEYLGPPADLTMVGGAAGPRQEIANTLEAARKNQSISKDTLEADKKFRARAFPGLLEATLQLRQELGKLVTGYLAGKSPSQFTSEEWELLKTRVLEGARDMEWLLQYFRPDGQVPQLDSCLYPVGNGQPSGTNCRLATEQPRVVDLIPRQGAMNVNSVQATRKIWSLNGFLSLLSGFGAKLDYERRRELFEQFMYQEVFASGFGKGTHTVGWRFGSLPGEDQLRPGLRNTYAVVAVPDDALSLEMQVWGCALAEKDSGLLDPAYHREDDCSTPENISVSLPRPASSVAPFLLDRMRYTQAEPGGRVTILIDGGEFGPQTAVLADGVALSRAVSVSDTGLAPLERTRDSLLANGSLKGTFEIVNRRLIALSLEAPTEYKTFPEIVLQGPVAALSIRDERALQVVENGVPITARNWWETAKLYRRPAPAALEITSVDVSSVGRGNVEAVLVGTFPIAPEATPPSFRVNGAPITATPTNKKLTILQFPEAPNLPVWTFLAYTAKDVKRFVIDNPMPPRQLNATCTCSIVAAVGDVATERRPAEAQIELTGDGFLDNHIPGVSGATLVRWVRHSGTLATVWVNNPSSMVRVSLSGQASFPQLAPCTAVCRR